MQKDIWILLVDDDEDEYVLLKNLVNQMPAGREPRQYHLDWTPNLEMALQASSQKAYDLFCVDYQLGKHTGLDLLRTWSNQGSNVPVILLTGQGNYEIDLAAMQEGASEYLVKDQLTSFALERAVRYSLERKRSKDELEMRVQERTRELAEANESLKSEISAREQIEQALRASENRLRVLAETTSAAIFIVQDDQIRYANTAAKFVTGFGLDELLKLKFWQLAHPAYQEGLRRRGLIQQWISHIPVRFELKILTKTGVERWVDITAGEMEYNGQPASVITAFDITDRDLAEKELQKAKAELETRVEERTLDLRKANQRLQIVFETLPVAIRIADAMGHVMDANNMVDKVWGEGAPPTETIQKYVAYRGWRADTGEKLKAEDWALARALSQGEISIGDVIDIERFDGTRSTILTSAAPIIDSDGRITGAVEVSQDITHQRQLEQDLQDAKRLAEQRTQVLEAVFSALPDAIIVHDKDGKIVEVNPAAVDLYGFNPIGLGQEGTIRRLSTRHANGRRISLDETVTSQALKGQKVSGDLVLLTNSEGRNFTFLVSASPVHTSNELIGAVSVLHDVTEREQLLVQLETEQARFKTLIENAPGAIIMADPQGHIILANPISEQILGQPINKGSGVKTESQLNLCYPDGRRYDPDDLILTRAAVKGETFSNVEMMVFLPDGQRRYILADAAPILDSKGKRSGAVGVFQDITKRKEKEQEVQDYALRSDVLATLSRAFAQAGLEYQTVLNTIAQKITDTLADACIIRLVSDDGEWLDPVAQHFNDPEAQKAFSSPPDLLREPVEDSPVGSITQTGQPLVLLETNTTEVQNILRAEVSDAYAHLPIQSLLVEPLQTQHHILGTLTVIRTLPASPYTQEDQAFFEELAVRAALAIENAMLHAEVKQLALRDSLTGEYNRRAFFDLGKEEIKLFHHYRQPLSAIMLDIDHFKGFNDQYGHALGDQILRKVIDHCRENIRHTDILGRYGGDEYAILLPHTSLITANLIAQRIRSAIVSTPFMTDAGPLSVTVSLGVTEATFKMKDIHALLEQADRALYAAKRKGRNRVETV
jgi:diguanylate cyclase (GGDEF)-like protein/PAS domain S-box-containing protein